MPAIPQKHDPADVLKPSVLGSRSKPIEPPVIYVNRISNSLHPADATRCESTGKVKHSVDLHDVIRNF